MSVLTGKLEELEEKASVGGAVVAETGLARLVAQRLAGPRAPDPAAAVRRLLAAQAQDLPGALVSTALRTDGAARAAVERALDAGELVRSWPMRGTLHLVAADDLPWLLALTAPRVVAGAGHRRARLELDDATLERAREVAVGALAGGRRLRRAELVAAWGGAGLPVTGQRAYHLLWHLAQTGTLCLGPLRDGEQQIVLLDEWITRPRRPEREEALGELAGRYFRGHGPASVRDFTRWTGLAAADVRAGVALARPGLEAAQVDGVEHLFDPEAPDRLRAHREEARGVLLLPGFDEFVLGYADRGAVLPPEHASLIVPGGNGVFRPTVVSGGRIVGTWRHAGRGARRTVEATPFAAFDEPVARAIPGVYGALP
jgi:hypothetical protein